MPHETHLERKLRQLGLSQDHSSNQQKRLTFRLYFPRPPYGSVEYTAAKQGEGLNFVGQLLGHGGSTLKRIQTESGTRVEVHDGKGNLNGTHPSYTDPTLHAVVFAENREKLNKAAQMIAEVLQPIDSTFEKFEVTPNGWALLKPAIRKSKSPRSESSGRKTAWGIVSTPSSETESLAQDIDSAYVQEASNPWKRLPQGSKSEDTLRGMRKWDTWGRNKSDGYNQFTAVTQSFVSQLAERSRQSKQSWESHYYSSQDPIWNPSPAEYNGANINAALSQFGTHNSIAESRLVTVYRAPETHYSLPHDL